MVVNLISILFGVVAGVLHLDFLVPYAQSLNAIFVQLMQCLAVPVIFFSLMHTVLDVGENAKLRKLFSRVLAYTFATTLLSATVAGLVYKLWHPAAGALPLAVGQGVALSTSYTDVLVRMVPSHIFEIFTSGNVASAVIFSAILGVIGRRLDASQYALLHRGIGALSSLFLGCARYLVRGLPFVLWSFILIFMQDIQKGFALGSVMLFVCAVLTAYVVQAFVLLPMILRSRGFSFFETFKQSAPSWSIAALSKSSAVAIPLTMQVCVERFKVRQDVARFTVPVCATINMNGCAALIMVTTAFMVEVYQGAQPLWVFAAGVLIATFVAIGNAGVPMGCFFMIVSVLHTLGIPTQMMGALLPIFALLDMMETGINVWGDIVITRCIDKDLRLQKSFDRRV